MGKPTTMHGSLTGTAAMKAALTGTRERWRNCWMLSWRSGTNKFRLIKDDHWREYHAALWKFAGMLALNSAIS